MGRTSAAMGDGNSFAPFAHELLNALASLRGCAQTLLLDADSLRSDVRLSLAEIVARQSDRLEWLIRATAPSPPGRTELSLVRISDIVNQACDFARVDLDVEGQPRLVLVNEGRLRLGLEALLLAFSHGGAIKQIRLEEYRLSLSSTVPDFDHYEQRWKISLARRSLKEHGCKLRVVKVGSGATGTVVFPRVVALPSTSEQRSA